MLGAETKDLNVFYVGRLVPPLEQRPSSFNFKDMSTIAGWKTLTDATEKVGNNNIGLIVACMHRFNVFFFCCSVK